MQSSIFLYGLGSLILLSSSLLQAAGLTDTESVAAGLQQPAWVTLQQARIKQAQGALLQSQLRPNPTLEVSREKLGDDSQTGFWLSQRIDIAGQRQWLTQAAQAELNAVEAEQQTLQREQAYVIRLAFYQALADYQQQQLFTTWLEKLNRISSDVQKRASAGDASGYDTRRMMREQSELQAELQQAQINFKANWQYLLGLIGRDSQSPNLPEGNLLPDAPPALADLLSQLPQQPQLQQLQQQLQAQQHKLIASERGKIPELTLGIGQQTSRSGSGLMLRAEMPLPLFDHNQAQRLQQQAKQEQAESEYQFVQQQQRTALQSSWQRASQLQQQAQMLADNRQQMHSLIQVAENAYRAGEVDVLNLLDAYRSGLSAENRQLKNALAARLARLELDKLVGGK